MSLPDGLEATPTALTEREGLLAAYAVLTITELLRAVGLTDFDVIDLNNIVASYR